MPTGSSDPFALRRAALGVVNLVLECKHPFSLTEAVAAAGRGVTVHNPKLDVTVETQKQVIEFLLDRARYVFVERHGFAHDEVNAALSAGCDDLVDASRRITALCSIRKTHNFEPLAISFKRVRNILEKAGSSDAWRLPAVRPELFQEEVEHVLHASAYRVAQQAEQHKRAGRYKEALQEIAELRPAVDSFFDQVMVMAEQEDVRRNRLTMLSELLNQFSTIADFSELVPSEKGN